METRSTDNTLTAGLMALAGLEPKKAMKLLVAMKTDKFMVLLVGWLTMTVIAFMSSNLMLIRNVMLKRSKICNGNEFNIQGFGMMANGMAMESSMVVIKNSSRRI